MHSKHGKHFRIGLIALVAFPVIGSAPNRAAAETLTADQMNAESENACAELAASALEMDGPHTDINAFSKAERENNWFEKCNQSPNSDLCLGVESMFKELRQLNDLFGARFDCEGKSPSGLEGKRPSDLIGSTRDLGARSSPTASELRAAKPDNACANLMQIARGVIVPEEDFPNLLATCAKASRTTCKTVRIMAQCVIVSGSKFIEQNGCTVSFDDSEGHGHSYDFSSLKCR